MAMGVCGWYEGVVSSDNERRHALPFSVRLNKHLLSDGAATTRRLQTRAEGRRHFDPIELAPRLATRRSTSWADRAAT